MNLKETVLALVSCIFQGICPPRLSWWLCRHEVVHTILLSLHFVGSEVISLVLCLILVICVLFLSWSLKKSILLIFSGNQILALLIFFFIPFIPALIFIISFLLLSLGLLCSSFSSFLSWNPRPPNFGIFLFYVSIYCYKFPFWHYIPQAWYIAYSLSFTLKHLKFFLVLSSLSYKLCKSVLLNFQIFGNFPSYLIFIVLKFNFTIILEYILYDFYPLNLWVVLWPSILSILVSLEKMCLLPLQGTVFHKYHLGQSGRLCCLDLCAWIAGLSIAKKEVLKPPIKIIELPVFPFNSVNFCFVYPEAVIRHILIYDRQTSWYLLSW